MKKIFRTLSKSISKQQYKNTCYRFIAKDHLCIYIALYLVVTACNSPNEIKTQPHEIVKTFVPDRDSIEYLSLNRKDSVLIFSRTYQFNSSINNCTIDIYYPMVKWNSKPAVATKLNSHILNFFEINKYRSQTDTEKCNSEEITKTYKYFIHNSILSIKLENNFIGSGAGHGYSNTQTLNLNLNNGNKVELQEIFERSKLKLLQDTLLKATQLKLDSLKIELPMEIIKQGIERLTCWITPEGMVFYTPTTNGQIQELNVFLSQKQLQKYLNTNTLPYNSN